MTKAATFRWIRIGLTALTIVMLIWFGLNYSQRDSTGSDPTSTVELSWLGGGTIEPLGWDMIAERTVLVAEVAVVDVRASYGNTPDGGFPSASLLLADATRHPLDGFYVLTDIDLEVVEVHSKAPDSTDDLNGSDKVTITLIGGLIHTVLDVEQTNALGVTVVEQQFPLRDTMDESIPPDVEVAVKPTGPVEYSYGYAPAERLTEGDRLLVFLTRYVVPGFHGRDRSILMPSHPYAVFYRSEEGQWISQYSPVTDQVDALELASRVAVP